ncbi:MAG: YlxR family protein [Clostridia bacterium]|nr:YlxR family protein [Clostridia bacterium]
MADKKIPMRMCVACREMKPKKDLIRVVKTADGIRLDKTGKLAGRGAYVCPNEDCIKKLSKQKIINKAFSMDVSPDVYKAIEEDFFGK